MYFKLNITNVVLPLLLLLLLVLILTSSFISIAEYSSWTFLSPEISRRIVLYDEDLDGEPEVLAIDNRIYTNLTGNISVSVITNPYKVDFNATGVLHLLLYNVLTGQLEVRYQFKSYIFTVLTNATLRVYRWGLLIYNATDKGVIVAGKFYTIPLDLNGIPILVDNKPIIIGSRGVGLILYDIDLRVEKTITLLNITVVEALYDKSRGVIYGVGSIDTTLLYFKYDGEKFTYRPLGISRLIQAITTSSRIYVLSSERVLYAINASGDLTIIADNVIALYYPADSVNSFIALTTNSVLKIVDVNGYINILRHPLPPLPLSEIYAIDWWGSILATATSRGVYIATIKPLYVSINAPLSTYAGDLVTIGVSGVYDGVLVNIAGRIYSGIGNLSLSVILPPGNITITAEACRGVFCVENTTNILVLKRPLKVRVVYPEIIAPYNSMNIFTETIDELTNTSISINCTIRDPGGRVVQYFNSGSTITIPAIPDVDSAVFTISCGGGNYELVDVNVRSKFTESYLKIGVKYYGSGLIEVYGYNKYTGEIWRGLVVVRYLNMTIIGEDKALITIPPGEIALRVLLVRDNITYYAEEFKVVYYEDVFAVPAGEAVIVADRVKVDVYTLTETITRPFPIYHEVRVIDPLIIAATSAFTAGAVYAILMLLGKLPRVKREKS